MKITRVGETTFRLQNHFTSKSFGLRGDPKDTVDSQAVIQIPLDKNAGRPDWAITRLAEGTFKITEPKSRKALTAKKEESGSGVCGVLDSFTNAEAQKWELEQIDPKTLTV